MSKTKPKPARKRYTSEQRSERARKAAQARWNSHNALKHADPQDPVFAQLLKAYQGRPMD